ncbi:MAG: SDR family NAD(P)-dependent oxidoreductase [Promethearchaeota archaeon]
MQLKQRKVPWFDQKTFVVTGGSSGIGLAISRQLAREGAKIIAVSFNPLEFPIAQEQLDHDQQSIDFLKCDITSAEDRKALKQTLLAHERSVAGVINAAGITTYGPFFETPVKALQKLADINFTGTMLFIREIFPLVLQDRPSETKYLGFICKIPIMRNLVILPGNV